MSYTAVVAVTNVVPTLAVLVLTAPCESDVLFASLGKKTGNIMYTIRPTNISHDKLCIGWTRRGDDRTTLHQYLLCLLD